jgi:hypothetical protein
VPTQDGVSQANFRGARRELLHILTPGDGYARDFLG